MAAVRPVGKNVRVDTPAAIEIAASLGVPHDIAVDLLLAMASGVNEGQREHNDDG